MNTDNTLTLYRRRRFRRAVSGPWNCSVVSVSWRRPADNKLTKQRHLLDLQDCFNSFNIMQFEHPFYYKKHECKFSIAGMNVDICCDTLCEPNSWSFITIYNKILCIIYQNKKPNMDNFTFQFYRRWLKNKNLYLFLQSSLGTLLWCQSVAWLILFASTHLFFLRWV